MITMLNWILNLMIILRGLTKMVMEIYELPLTGKSRIVEGNKVTGWVLIIIGWAARIFFSVIFLVAALSIISALISGVAKTISPSEVKESKDIRQVISQSIEEQEKLLEGQKKFE